MKRLGSALAALCLCATSAWAIPVTWDINYTDPFFSAIGAFTYDADTDSYSDISIDVTNTTFGTNGTVTTLLDQFTATSGGTVVANSANFVGA